MPSDAIVYACAKCGLTPLYAHRQDEYTAIACSWCEQVYCGNCIHFPAVAECRVREGGKKVA